MRILVVDDHAPGRELAARLLAVLGFEMVGASDEHEAERLLAQHGDDLVVAMVDVFVGANTASRLTRRLQTEHAELPVLFTSGYCREICLAMNLLGPDRPFVEKPFSVSRLAAALHAVLAPSALRAAPGP